MALFGKNISRSFILFSLPRLMLATSLNPGHSPYKWASLRKKKKINKSEIYLVLMFKIFIVMKYYFKAEFIICFLHSSLSDYV